MNKSYRTSRNAWISILHSSTEGIPTGLRNGTMHVFSSQWNLLRFHTRSVTSDETTAEYGTGVGRGYVSKGTQYIFKEPSDLGGPWLTHGGILEESLLRRGRMIRYILVRLSQSNYFFLTVSKYSTVFVGIPYNPRSTTLWLRSTVKSGYNNNKSQIHYLFYNSSKQNKNLTLQVDLMHAMLCFSTD